MTGFEFRRIRGQGRRGKKTGPSATSGRRLREVLFFIKLTGTRPKEVRDLLWSDIDPVAGIARLEHHTRRVPSTPTTRRRSWTLNAR
jgi:integrase